MSLRRVGWARPLLRRPVITMVTGLATIAGAGGLFWSGMGLFVAAAGLATFAAFLVSAFAGTAPERSLRPDGIARLWLATFAIVVVAGMTQQWVDAQARLQRQRLCAQRLAAHVTAIPADRNLRSWSVCTISERTVVEP